MNDDPYPNSVARQKGLPLCVGVYRPGDQVHKLTQKCLKKKNQVNKVICFEYKVNKNWNRMVECMSTGRWKESCTDLKRRCKTECKGPKNKRPGRCIWDPKAKTYKVPPKHY